MSVINKPDIKGTACEFCPRCLRLDSLGGVNNYSAGTPPCMPNYSLGAQTCWPLANENIVKEKSKLAVYPNPSSSIFYIKTKSKEERELYNYNSVGQLLFSTNQNSIDVSGLASGVYYLKVGFETQKVLIE